MTSIIFLWINCLLGLSKNGQYLFPRKMIVMITHERHRLGQDFKVLCKQNVISIKWNSTVSLIIHCTCHIHCSPPASLQSAILYVTGTGGKTQLMPDRSAPAVVTVRPFEMHHLFDRTEVEFEPDKGGRAGEAQNEGGETNEWSKFTTGIQLNIRGGMGPGKRWRMEWEMANRRIQSQPVLWAALELKRSWEEMLWAEDVGAPFSRAPLL